ncbi:hypothetical protein [Novacetimonas hansenii]|uniref:hypothetical protein n=1 Tax=Novacetimonas hansenii TaxID=436 RepID=UPI00248F28FA|nr:hypothetical protein [Novacetimonas hansenii]
MRTREEQIAELVDGLEKPVCRPDYSVSILEKWLERHILEAERRAEQRVRAEIAKRHTWFYMVDDPESGHADLADMLCETKPFEIVETSEAADICIFFAYQDEDGEIYEFPNRNEAEQAARAAIDAAREAQG